MLRQDHALLFPRLIDVTNDEEFLDVVESEIFCADTMELLKIDWESFERYFNERHDKRRESMENPTPYFCYPLEPSIPKKYADLLRNQVYLIPKLYVLEMQMHCEIARLEMGRRVIMETSLHEESLSPAFEHVYTAFNILHEHAFSVEHMNADNSTFARILAVYASLYRFWFYQVGDGRIQQCSRFERLRLYLTDLRMKKDRKPTLFSDVAVFIDSFDQHYNDHVIHSKWRTEQRKGSIQDANGSE